MFNKWDDTRIIWVLISVTLLLIFLVVFKILFLGFDKQENKITVKECYQLTHG